MSRTFKLPQENSVQEKWWTVSKETVVTITQMESWGSMASSWVRSKQLEQETSRGMLAVVGTSTLSSRRKQMGKTRQQGRARLARNPLELLLPRGLSVQTSVRG